MRVEPAGVLLEDMADRAEQLLDRFPPRNLSNLVWAFARLQHKPGAASCGACLYIHTNGNEFSSIVVRGMFVHSFAPTGMSFPASSTLIVELHQRNDRCNDAACDVCSKSRLPRR